MTTRDSREWPLLKYLGAAMSIPGDATADPYPEYRYAGCVQVGSDLLDGSGFQDLQVGSGASASNSRTRGIT